MENQVGIDVEDCVFGWSMGIIINGDDEDEHSDKFFYTIRYLSLWNRETIELWMLRCVPDELELSLTAWSITRNAVYSILIKY